MLFSKNIPAHEFNAMFEALCTGRKGSDFLDKVSINDLSAALNNSYIFKENGSHVGGVRELFLDLGPWGKEVYDKFFIDEKIGGHARSFLAAIANYKSVPSFEGASDAVSDRDQPIRALFEKPTVKQVDTPVDFHPGIDKVKTSVRNAFESG